MSDQKNDQKTNECIRLYELGNKHEQINACIVQNPILIQDFYTFMISQEEKKPKKHNVVKFMQNLIYYARDKDIKQKIKIISYLADVANAYTFTNTMAGVNRTNEDIYNILTDSNTRKKIAAHNFISLAKECFLIQNCSSINIAIILEIFQYTIERIDDPTVPNVIFVLDTLLQNLNMSHNQKYKEWIKNLYQVTGLVTGIYEIQTVPKLHYATFRSLSEIADEVLSFNADKIITKKWFLEYESQIKEYLGQENISNMELSEHYLFLMQTLKMQKHHVKSLIKNLAKYPTEAEKALFMAYVRYRYKSLLKKTDQKTIKKFYLDQQWAREIYLKTMEYIYVVETQLTVKLKEKLLSSFLDSSENFIYDLGTYVKIRNWVFAEMKRVPNDTALKSVSSVLVKKEEKKEQQNPTQTEICLVLYKKAEKSFQNKRISESYYNHLKFAISRFCKLRAIDFTYLDTALKRYYTAFLAHYAKKYSSSLVQGWSENYKCDKTITQKILQEDKKATVYEKQLMEDAIEFICNPLRLKRKIGDTSDEDIVTKKLKT